MVDKLRRRYGTFVKRIDFDWRCATDNKVPPKLLNSWLMTWNAWSSRPIRMLVGPCTRSCTWNVLLKHSEIRSCNVNFARPARLLFEMHWTKLHESRPYSTITGSITTGREDARSEAHSLLTLVHQNLPGMRKHQQLRQKLDRRIESEQRSKKTATSGVKTSKSKITWERSTRTAECWLASASSFISVWSDAYPARTADEDGPWSICGTAAVATRRRRAN